MSGLHYLWTENDAYPVLIYIKFSGKKLDDGKGIGGRGRLTAVRIDAMQNFYGKAIRDNKGNATAMSKATHAILKHYSSTPENPRHEDCPSGNESWCSYNRDLATGQTTHCPIQDPLPQAVVNVIQPTFDRLGGKHFLAGCEKCLDQNNKWKSPSCHLVHIVTKGTVYFSLNVEVQAGMITGWQRIEGKRMSSSNYKAQPAVKKRRKKHWREKSKRQDGFVYKEGVRYSSQRFY